MYPVRAAHNIYLLDLVEEHEIFPCDSLVDNVAVLLTYLSNNVRVVQQDDNSGHEYLSANDLTNIIKFFKAVMKPRSYGQYSFLHSSAGLWFKILLKGAETDSNNSNSEEHSSRYKRKVQSWPVLDVERGPVHYTRAVGNCKQSPAARKSCYTNF